MIDTLPRAVERLSADYRAACLAFIQKVPRPSPQFAIYKLVERETILFSYLLGAFLASQPPGGSGWQIWL
jgi:hypothetical protein